MGFYLIVSVIIYVFLSIALTKKLAARMPAGKKRRLAVVGAVLFFVLLPTWDAVIGYPIYKYYCMTWAGQEIHKTVESEGIYFEGNSLYPLSDIGGTIHILGAEDILREGFQFVESKSTRLRSGGSKIKDIPPITYKCEWKKELPKKRDFRDMNCYTIITPSSSYRTIFVLQTVLTASFHSTSIYDRSNSQLIAEERVASQSYLGLGVIPFFNWLHWYDRGETTYLCGGNTLGFEFKVIKPIKPEEGASDGKHIK